MTCVGAEWNKVITAVKDISIYTVPIYQQQFGRALGHRPRLNLIRFQGVLAPNAKLRYEIIPSPPKPATAPTTDHAHAQGAARRRSESISSKRPASQNGCRRRPALLLVLSLSERPDGEPITRFRPPHRPNDPKQSRTFRHTLMRLKTHRYGDIAPVSEKGD